MHENKQIDAIDIFCGAGGLSYGLAQAGINIKAGADIDPACRFPFEANIGARFIETDIRAFDVEKARSFFSSENYSLLAGCAPCQPFSRLNAQKKLKTNEERWGLLTVFSDLAVKLMPDFITMENVISLRKQDIFKLFCSVLEDKGYHFSINQVRCPEYGVPQNRERLVVIASRLGPIQLIPATHNDGHVVTVQDAIGDLPPIKAGKAWAKDPLHRSAALSDLNLQRIRVSKPNETWASWPEHLIADCHKRLKKKNFNGSYGRMAWDSPSPTITTQCFGYSKGRFGHPTQDRAISLREAALLQTFPKNYAFIPEGTAPKQATLGRLIGNAVPVRLGEVVGMSFNEHLKGLSDV